MISDRITGALRILEAYLKAGAPYDTGNLALNSIRIVQRSGDWCVVVGGEIADYAVYTNEAWTADRWNGKQNPNEGWIDREIQSALPQVRSQLTGTMTQAEYEQIIATQQQRVKTTQQQRLQDLGIEDNIL